MEIFIILLILCVLVTLFQAKIKGILGEKAVASRLSGLPTNKYRILNDIMLETSYGTTQIDHVVVSGYSEIMFSEEQLGSIVDSIMKSNITTKESKKQHVQQIRTKVREDNSKVRQGICPKCGGDLVKRKGKYGTFMGCNNYPKCKYHFWLLD